MQQSFFEEVFTLLPTTIKKIVNQSCLHQNTCCDEGDKTTCLDCGELLQENYTLTLHYNSGMCMTNRKIAEPSIYAGIPDFVDRDIKELTIKIYEVVTDKKHFRNKTKKSILLACLHRASNLKNSPISYYELLEIYKLKQHEANHGFMVLSSNIPKSSEHFKIFDHTKEEILGINSKLKQLKQLKIEDENSCLFRLVVNTFLLLKKASNAVNSSQYTSVICGCIYFWIVHYLDKSVDIETFIEEAAVSKITLLKNYMIVCDVVFKSILKELFSELLQKCVPIQLEKTGTHKTKTLKKNVVDTEDEECVYKSDEKYKIKKPFDVSNITVENDGNVLPLDFVNDILEWNLLLNRCYFTSTTKIMLYVLIIKSSSKDIYFDFSNFNKFNKLNGNKILKKVLERRFDVDVQTY